jgi:hypothetical protein
MKRSTTWVIVVVIVFWASLDSAAQRVSNSVADEEWPQFRGPDAIPVSVNPNLPSRWSADENVEWATDIPGTGWSSPIVWGGKVFVTSAVGNKPMKQPSLGVDFSNDYVAELQEQGLPMEEVIAKVTRRDNEMPDEIDLKYQLFCLDLSTGNMVWDREFFAGPPPVGRHRKNSYTS